MGRQVSAAGCSPLHPRQQRTWHRARQLRHSRFDRPERNLLTVQTARTASRLTYDPKRLQRHHRLPGDRAASLPMATASSSRPQIGTWTSRTAIWAPSNRSDGPTAHRAAGWRQGRLNFRHHPNAPLRSRLCRDLTQLAGPHRGSRPRQHGHATRTRTSSTPASPMFPSLAPPKTRRSTPMTQPRSARRLSTDVSKTSAVDFQQRQEPHHNQHAKETAMSDGKQEREDLSNSASGTNASSAMGSDRKGPLTARGPGLHLEAILWRYPDL